MGVNQCMITLQHVPDSQLDLGSPYIGNLKEGLHLRKALIFTCHYYFKGIARKA